MSWRSIFGGLAFCLGFYLVRFMLGVFHAPMAVAVSIEVPYAIALWIYLIYWLVWSFKVLFGSRRTAG